MTATLLTQHCASCGHHRCTADVCPVCFSADRSDLVDISAAVDQVHETTVVFRTFGKRAEKQRFIEVLTETFLREELNEIVAIQPGNALDGRRSES